MTLKKSNKNTATIQTQPATKYKSANHGFFKVIQDLESRYGRALDQLAKL